uniref:Polymerase basic protein 2 n=1 Tax=Wuhan spiny eel influenza virus TaxID=2116483 RepID=A0A2P1GNS6_9ORTO|nr:PB2 [Wuhan spiny eel influenza virus]
MTYDKIVLLKKLMQSDEAREVLTRTTVDQFTIIRKFNTSRMEKNPSLRMKWAMCSNFPIALSKGEFADMIPVNYTTKGSDPEKDKGAVIPLKTTVEDIGTKGQLCSIAAVTWWNTYGPIEKTDGFERVYKAFFDRRIRLDNGSWGNLRFGPVERVRKRVLLNPLTKEMSQDEAGKVIMEVLFPREAGVPSESTWLHRDLIKEKRKMLEGTLIAPIVLAHMLERELVARRRFLPVSGATSAEYVEILHCLQGENWTQDYLPGGTSMEESRQQTMIVACRKIVRRAIVSPSPLETAVEIASRTKINSEPLKSCLNAIAGGDIACDLISEAMGIKIRQRQRFGRMEMKRISGRGIKVDEEILIGNGTIIKVGIWDGNEEFNVRVGECRGILKKSKRKMEKLLISRSNRRDMRDLIILAIVFSQDSRMFKLVRGATVFMNRAGQVLPAMYQLQRYFLDNPNSLLDYWEVEHTPRASELIGVNADMEEGAITLKGVIVTKGTVDDFASYSTERTAVTTMLTVVKRATGEVIMGANDVSELESVPQLPIQYDTPKMWELGTTKELVQNVYTWVLKNLTTLKAQFLLGREDMFKWEVFEAFESKVPKSFAGKYSGFCRSLLQQMRDSNSFKTEQFVKLLPFCFPEPVLTKEGTPYQFIRLTLKGGGTNYIHVRSNSPLLGYNKTTMNMSICGRVVNIKGNMDPEEETRGLGNAVLAGFLVSGKADPDLGDYKTIAELSKLKPGEKANVLLYHGKPVKVIKRKRSCALSVDVTQGIKRQRLTVESMRYTM